MGEDIRLTAGDGHEVDAYLARPAGTARGGVVVIQEIFGVNGHIRDVCERFAGEGYLAVAPAIFDRAERGVQLDYTPDGMTQGRGIRAKIDMNDVIKDVSAAADRAAEGGKVGIVGYCWGGLIVYVSACRLGDKLVCASGYYGANIKTYLSETPAVPTILHFGTLDASIPMNEVEDIRAAHPDVVVNVYEGADHGFNCDQRKQFHPDAAKLAQERTLALFAEHLS